jgi:hypothetical protein
MILRKVLCNVLIALMAWAPFQMANASMIGTDRIAAASAQSDRARVLSALDRSDAAGALQTYGLTRQQAKDRVNAMSDDEVTALAGRIDSLPAGGHGWGTVLVIAIIVGVVWWASTRAR